MQQVKSLMRRNPAVLFLGLGLAAGGHAVAAEHGHDHGQAQAHGDAAGAPAGLSALTLNHGKRWATDEGLRQGMTHIRKLMDAAIPAIHADEFDAARYTELAGRLHGEVGSIIVNCRLDQETDAALHRVLNEVLTGIDQMKAEAGAGTGHDGAISVLGALDAYGTYFNHPGWQPLAQ